MRTNCSYCPVSCRDGRWRMKGDRQRPLWVPLHFVLLLVLLHCVDQMLKNTVRPRRPGGKRMFEVDFTGRLMRTFVIICYFDVDLVLKKIAFFLSVACATAMVYGNLPARHISLCEQQGVSESICAGSDPRG